MGPVKDLRIRVLLLTDRVISVKNQIFKKNRRGKGI